MNIPIMNNHDLVNGHQIGTLCDDGVVRFDHPIPYDAVRQMFGNVAIQILACEQGFVCKRPSVLYVTAVKIVQWAVY